MLSTKIFLDIEYVHQIAYIIYYRLSDHPYEC